ncbi:MBL fold metallo-hydrolase [Marinobacter fonticola]|uniref:MBL fold metallo-hydrolase n=1 Tax=Marinobacter fonticola TaxID=2603215 RepID=UPI0011E769BF|nr:MBL fold metallo-hydrolase [Marinobacter fonticola]
MQPRPASTLALLRESTSGFEVLMLQRSHQAVFMPGFYVFPGGAVDEGDQHDDLLPHLEGHDDASASKLLNLKTGGLGYLTAAIRECFEEAGLLLAQDRDGKPVGTEHPAFNDARERLARGELDLPALCQNHNLRLPLDRLAYIDHWITPPGPPRRFDTRFFVAEAPAGQIARHDGEETIDHCWLNPQAALEEHRAGQRLFGAPTLSVIRRLARYKTLDEALGSAIRAKPMSFPTEPWPARRNDEIVQLSPGQPAYQEARKLDPKGQGTVNADIEPGAWVRLAENIWRLTVPNPSVMTGPGTNTYVIEDPAGHLVIDPGPRHEEHLQRILEKTGGKVRAILATHTHSDHSPGAGPLKAATGAETIGLAPPGDGLQDMTFAPDYTPEDGEWIELQGSRLKMIHTPGHASNHLCFLHEGERVLFSGDHIMQGSTVVINPPDGDMKAYLNSLNRLLEEDIDWIAPGHGFLMGYPQMTVDYLVTHRLSREHKVIAALRKLGPAPLETLVPEAYADAAPALHRIAARSLLAHLLKLEQEGRAQLQDGHWVWSA